MMELIEATYWPSDRSWSRRVFVPIGWSGPQVETFAQRLARDALSQPWPPLFPS